jgi:hypothetical protein
MPSSQPPQGQGPQGEAGAPRYAQRRTSVGLERGVVWHGWLMEGGDGPV